MPGEILLTMYDDLPALFQNQDESKAIQSASARFESYGLSHGEVLMDLKGSGQAQGRLITKWVIPADIDVAALARTLSKLPGVAYAEPNYVWSASLIPNDTSFGNLWGMNNTGQSGGTPDADIDAVEAWNLTTGSSSVIVGVIDSGVDYNHPDLVGNIWVNPNEIPGDNIDNDNNGYIDDIHGINAITGTGNPMDDNNHGTHVAGTIGAKGNNTNGVVGVNWNVKIAAAKFLNANGSGSTADAIESFQYFKALKASGQNIVVTNNSWGGGGFSQALSDAMAGSILHAVAAGNANNNNDSAPSYPASYHLDNIVAVAATDRFDKYASFSSFGLTSVDLAAPGVSILSTTPNNTYSTFNGTSMATPHVAGAAALVSSMYPLLTAVQLKQVLMNGTDIVGGIGTNSTKRTVTDGRLNVYQTLINLSEIDTVAPNSVTDLVASAPGQSTATLTWTATGDDGAVGTARSYDVRFSTSAITESNWSSATKAAGEPRPQSAGSPETFRVSGLASDVIYYFALKVQDNLGNESGLSNITNIRTIVGTTVFADGFENGLSQWTAQSPWGVTSTNKNSGSFSVTDSPSANYANNANSSLTSKTIDLSGFKESQLSFWHRYDLEQGYDYGRFEVSLNGGTNWTMLASYNGTSTSFQKVTFDFSVYDGKPSVMIRFRLQSDSSIVKDGWYVDDLQIVGVPVPTPGFQVTPTTGLVTTEAGGQASFTVSLKMAPTADVTIPISSSDTTEGSVSVLSLTFTTSNWNAPQTVTVTGVDDLVVDGNIAYSIVLGASTSTDPRYQGLDPSDVSVTNIDNDVYSTKLFTVDDASPDRSYEYSYVGVAIKNSTLDSGNSAPRGAASVGNEIWVVDKNLKVYVYSTSGGLQRSWTAGTLASNAQIEGIATNGVDVWIVDARTDKVFKYTNVAALNGVTKNSDSNFSLASGNTSPSDIVTDGTSLWVVNDSSTDKVFKYNIDGTSPLNWTISSGGGSPKGITIDPNNANDIWIVDSSTDRVYQFSGGRRTTAVSLSPSSSFALAAGNSNSQGIASPPLASTNSNAIVGGNDNGMAMVGALGLGQVPMASLDAPLQNIASTTMNRHQTKVRSTEVFMSYLGSSSQLPHAPANVARATPVVSSKSIDPSESDEYQMADDNISDLIDLVANNLLRWGHSTLV